MIGVLRIRRGARSRTVSNCRRPPQSHGAVLLAALAAMLIALLLGAALARSLAFHHRQSRIEQQRQQAFWLAESASQRAITRLRASAEYSGETWRTTIETHGKSQTGVAEIRVQPAADNSSKRVITIDARWPDQPLERVLENRQLSIEIPTSEASL